MADFDYSRRSERVRIAHAELRASFDEMQDRTLVDDPRTIRWEKAVASFHHALSLAYPAELAELEQGERPPSDIATATVLDFLEADPVHFGSGYLKEKVLVEIRRRKLSEPEASRLRSIMLQIVKNGDQRREFRYYCRAAHQLQGEEFREELSNLESSEDPKVARRANWMLAALEGRFAEIARASADVRRQRGDGWISRTGAR